MKACHKKSRKCHCNSRIIMALGGHAPSCPQTDRPRHDLTKKQRSLCAVYGCQRKRSSGKPFCEDHCFSLLHLGTQWPRTTT